MSEVKKPRMVPYCSSKMCVLKAKGIRAVYSGAAKAKKDFGGKKFSECPDCGESIVWKKETKERAK